MIAFWTLPSNVNVVFRYMGTFHDLYNFMLSFPPPFKALPGGFFLFPLKFSLSPISPTSFLGCAVFSDTVLTLKALGATMSIAHPEQSDEKAVQM